MISTPPAAEVRLRRRLLRRWRLVVVGIIATIGLCLAATVLVPAKYTAGAILLLTPPPTTGPNGSPNPYLALGGLQPVADVLARALTSDTTLHDLRAAGLTGTYTVARDPLSDGPILNVTITSRSSDAALRDLGLLVGAAQPRLNDLQATESIPTKDRVSVQAVASATQAKASRKSQVRALVVAAAVGLIGTALGVTLLDVLLMRRRSRRAAVVAPAVAQPDPVTAPPLVVAAIQSQAGAEAQPAIAAPDVAEHAAFSGRRRLLRARQRIRRAAKAGAATGDLVRSGVRETAAAEPDSIADLTELLAESFNEGDAFGAHDVPQRDPEAVDEPTSDDTDTPRDDAETPRDDPSTAEVETREPAPSRRGMDALAQPIVLTKWRRMPGRSSVRLRWQDKSESSESGATAVSEASRDDRVGATSH